MICWRCWMPARPPRWYPWTARWATKPTARPWGISWARRSRGYERVEDRAWMEWVFSQVTPTERRLLELRYVHRMGQRETAAHLGVSQMQVSRMERRILARLRQSEESRQGRS